MLFPTTDFALFFGIVFLLAWLTNPHPIRWKVLLLGASYLFYGWWDVRFLLLLGFISAAAFLFGRAVHLAVGPRRRGLMVAAVAVDLGVLAWFKYYGFFVSSAASVLHRVGLGSPLPLLQVVLPVGISFFTFQAIAYVVDIYRGQAEPANLLDVAVYLSFFPHLVAGPIVRPHEFLPQLRERRDPRAIDASRAIALIAGGLAKKVVLATFLSTRLVDVVFANPGRHSAVEVLAAIYGYAVVIWADFSGYTDMAIGLALLLGIRFPQNFDSPYTARTLQDFWRRWHMTLSRWLRDYVYIPLGGNQRGRRRTYINLMLTMLLGGLWHGAAWTFVIWGGLHGLGLAVGRWRQEEADQAAAEVGEAKEMSAGRAAVQRLLVFHFVCLAWIFFRADSLTTVGHILGRLSSWGGASPLVTPMVVAAIAAGIVVQYIPRETGARLQVTFSRIRPALQGALLGLGLTVMLAVGPQGVAPFIYYRF